MSYFPQAGPLNFGGNNAFHTRIAIDAQRLVVVDSLVPFLVIQRAVIYWLRRVSQQR